MFRRCRGSNWYSVSSFVLLIFLSLVSGLLTSCAAELQVYYTASLNGNLLGCDCWGYPEAGLDKRAWYLGRNPPPENAILLDAGNFLETGEDPFLAEMILTTYRELGYCAAGTGTHELAEGLDTLTERARNGLFLSNNLLVDGVPVSASPRILKIGKTGLRRIAVISLADPDWFTPYLNQFGGRLSIADASDVLLRMRSAAGDSGAECVVLLAQGSEKWIRSLADAGIFGAEKPDNGDPDEYPPHVSAVVLAGEENLLYEKLPGGIPLVSPGEEGNRLGILKIHPGSLVPRSKNKFIEFHFLGPGDPTVIARGTEYADYLDKIRSSE